MATLEEKKADWLHQHFQAISRASNYYLYLLGTATVFSFVAFLSDHTSMKVPGLDMSIPRDLVLSASALIGSFLVVAFCGNYDKGEHTIQRLADTLGCEYEKLDFIDTHPNVFDFAKFASASVVASRGYAARLTVSLLYPLVLLIILGWFAYVVIYELFMYPVTGVPLAIYVAVVPVLFVAWRRAQRYVSRRWRTFLAIERAGGAGVSG